MAEALHRHVKMLLLCLLLGLGLPHLAAGDERVILALDIEQPRSFGYQLGDRFARVVHLELRAPYVLTLDKLPAAGRFSEFLALEMPRVDTGKRADANRYTIRFDYQVVNVGAAADAIAVPHHELEYSNGKESLKALIPATRVRVTPLRGANDTALADDQAPMALPFTARPLMLWATGFVCSLLALVHLRVDLWSSRSRRPFAVALRAVRGARRRGWHEADHDEALRAVHRAFNDTAGRTVFADALAQFFAEHAPFTRERDAVTAFYARSRSHFYGGEAPERAPAYVAEELLALVERCRDIERGLA